MTEFDWKRDAPTWVVLRFIQMKDAFTASYRLDKNIEMIGWKATPKGGKLSYSIDNKPYVVQLYR